MIFRIALPLRGLPAFKEAGCEIFGAGLDPCFEHGDRKPYGGFDFRGGKADVALVFAAVEADVFPAGGG